MKLRNAKWRKEALGGVQGSDEQDFVRAYNLVVCSLIRS